MYPKTRPSWGMALWLESRMWIPVWILACAALAPMIYYVDHSIQPVEDAWLIYKITCTGMLSTMMPLCILTSAFARRQQPTQEEFEERERDLARRLLEKYPELRQEGDQ